eukprot:gene19407-21330_t
MASNGEREEELRLLNEDENHQQDDKNRPVEGSGVLACLRSNFKLVLGVLTIVTLVILGVVVGAVSNSRNKGLGRNARAEFHYEGIRLPKDIIPLRYRIYLHPNLTNFEIFGATRILVNCAKATKKIYFHFKSNDIIDIKLMKGSYLDRKIKGNEKDIIVDNEYRINTKKELIMVESKANLVKGENYTLVIRYNGTLTAKLNGFYKSTYKTKSGEKRTIATTHFEPATARTAFPCFDEPGMKATFRIIIVRTKGYEATSNMPLFRTKIQQKDGVNLYVDHFNESVRMSTYLVCFIVHDFASKVAYTKRGIKIRVLAPADQIDQADFAIQTAPKVLDYYEDFFQVPFPLPKQDMIAIPDFSSGAMENWGIVTYRMTSILYNKDVSSDHNKQWVATVIAHEFAHQWFGNLVTMKWWNDLWLNEGFASFMESVGVDHVAKSWKMMEQFSNDKTHTAMILDAHSGSHPISVKVKDPKDIASIFDNISYDKGACVIRMLKNFIGTSAFHKGLQSYMKKYQFDNADTDQLWECFSKASGKDVKSMMDTWIKQMGFPLVTFKRDPANSQNCHVTQKYFSSNGKLPAQNSPYGYKWDVPLTYKTASTKTEQKLLSNHTKGRISVPCPTTNEWIKLNSDSIGYYRVDYDVENWQLISKQLIKDHKAFTTADRANIFADIFQLARIGEQSYNLAFGMTEYFKNEVEYTPWSSLSSSLGFIGHMLRGGSGYSDFKKYMRSIVKPQLLKLGWEDKGEHLQKYLRSILFHEAVLNNDTEAVKVALKLFRGYKINGTRIGPNLKGAVYFAGVRYGTRDDWDFLWSQHEATVVATEKRKIETALTHSKDPEILKMYLNWSLDSSKIKTQESVSIITGISANEYGEQLAWDFTLKNWQTLYDRYGDDSFDLPELIDEIVGGSRTKSRLKEQAPNASKNMLFSLDALDAVTSLFPDTASIRKEATKFFKTHELGSGKRSLKQSLESIQNHIDWKKKHEKEVTKWLKAYNKRNEAVGGA